MALCGAQALIGAARIMGIIPETNGAYLLPKQTGLVSYFNPDRVLHGEENIRFVTSFVYTFGKYH